jgi:NADPH:quinone reductase-like Zn-dependent oxidoreductase
MQYLVRPLLALVACLLATEAGATPEAMRAAVIVDGSVQLTTRPIPQPDSGQVRIKVRAASVNPVDWKLAAHAQTSGTQIPGRDLSGIVEAVGPGVTEWHVGDPVVAIAAAGSYAEYALASARAVYGKPAVMSYAEAAGLPVVGETAWRAIVVVAKVQKGQRVLIHGGAGGVGSSAVQIAKSAGAYVIATASARNQAFLHSLGADETIDYTATRFEDHVSGVDVVLNTVDADTGSRSMHVLRKDGILVSVVGPPPADQCTAAQIRCAITGSVTGEFLPQVVALANTGAFRVSIEERLPLGEAAKAWEESRAGHTRGKIILEP